MLFRPEQLHASVFVAAGARIVGDVTIDEQSSVWFNAVLRGDTEPIRIGKRTNVQDLCVLHADPGFPCVLEDGVTLGHRAIVHGAVIEEDSLIGMGAIVMNGARIGAGSIIGVGAVVTEGVEVPPGSLVLGLPGKVRRQVTAEELANNRRIAGVYVARAKAYQSESK